jgi:hypothetical protein
MTFLVLKILTKIQEAREIESIHEYCSILQNGKNEGKKPDKN